MKLLLTLPEPFFPADTGGKIRSLNIFSRLAKRTEIHAVSFANLPRDSEGVAQMHGMFTNYTPVPWSPQAKYSLPFYGQLVANQLNSLPYFLAKRDLPSFRSRVQSLAASAGIDLLFCDFLHTAAPLLGFPFKPRVVFQHNVEFLLRKRKWEVERNPLRKWVFANEWRKTRTIEAQVCRAFDKVITVSNEDSHTLHREFGIEQAAVLPSGVDTDFFSPDQSPITPGRLVFVGSMDWDPNEDGVLWFLREVYPRIRQQARHVSLSIVGRSPSSRLRAIAAGQPAVKITGWVQDVRPHLSGAEVVIVPLRVGGGTRIKIPEAMAMAKVVVSTPIGAEGLPFRDGREIRIAEAPEQFAYAVTEIIGNQRLRTQLAEAARRIVVDKHSWESVVARLEEVLAQVGFQAGKTAA
jgi:glycosyltransferase involved in cell wall biosynthesis